MKTAHTCQPTQAALTSWARRQGLTCRKNDWDEFRLAFTGLDPRETELSAAYVQVREWRQDWLEMWGTARAMVAGRAILYGA